MLVLLTTAAACASKMEQCSYKVEHDGKIESRTETPGLADGSNQKRFAEIAKFEEDGKEGWRGYRTFDVNCRSLDGDKPEWNMFVQTYNGQVSLQHGLTEDACFYVLAELRDGPWRGCHNSCSRSVEPSDFERGECFK